MNRNRPERVFDFVRHARRHIRKPRERFHAVQKHFLIALFGHIVDSDNRSDEVLALIQIFDERSHIEVNKTD